jgi:hypothetical protein
MPWPRCPALRAVPLAALAAAEAPKCILKAEAEEHAAMASAASLADSNCEGEDPGKGAVAGKARSGPGAADGSKRHLRAQTADRAAELLLASLRATLSKTSEGAC